MSREPGFVRRRLSRLRLPRFRLPGVLALPAGLAMGLGQPPFSLWPLALAGLALLLALIATAPGVRAGFWRAWAGGAAGFALSMVWIIEPFLVEPEIHGWMAPFALVLLPGGLALFWGLAGAFAVWAARGVPARLALAGVALLGAEALRGWAFTGLPWAQAGHIWIDTPVLLIAALGGAYALSALSYGAAAMAAGAWLAWHAGRRGAGLALAAGAGLLLGGAWGWGLAGLARPLPDDQPLRLRLVQPNAAQPDKWDPRFAEFFFRRHLDLSTAPAADGRAPDLVIWSETAVPFFLNNPGNALAVAAQRLGPDTGLILGVQRAETGADGVRRYFNSLAVLDETGAPAQVYDKHHLVPFGEYMPLLGRFSDRFGGLAAQVLTGYSAGPGPRLLDLGDRLPGAGRVLPLICYEAVFARNLRGTERPDWLLQVTNDAWFGARIGPFQHLAQARLRAVEQGLPMARVANTGVSAMIDARGTLREEIGMDRAGFIDADLPGALPPTPYARIGDWPWYLGLTLIIALAGAGRLRKRD